MKKTLITLAALTMASVASAAENISITPNATSTGKGAYSGWIGTLSDSCLTASTQLTEEVILSQISITTPNDNVTSPSTTVKLAIHEYSDMSSVGTFMGISTNAPTYSKNSTWTFDFSDIKLDADKIYRFSFVTAAADDTTNSPWQDVGASVRIDVAFVEGLGDSKGTTASGNAGSWASHGYMPNVTYTVSNVSSSNVPEPATATLSLLALAGLAARRRRK